VTTLTVISDHDRAEVAFARGASRSIPITIKYDELVDMASAIDTFNTT
jgi:hypothetical protein